MPPNQEQEKEKPVQPFRPSERVHQVEVRIEKPAEAGPGLPGEHREEEKGREFESGKIREAPPPEQEGVSAAPITTAPPVPAPLAPKSELRKSIENILSEGLFDVYQQLDDHNKEIFRVEGEEAASKIEQLLTHVKVRAQAILNIIRHWLKLIPGVNRFFLIKEAKIKTDRIMALRERKP